MIFLAFDALTSETESAFLAATIGGLDTEAHLPDARCSDSIVRLALIVHFALNSTLWSSQRMKPTLSASPGCSVTLPI